MNTVSHSAPNPAAPDATDADTRLGESIRAHRVARGLTLRDVAARSGVAIGTLSQLERGIASPSLKILREVCAAIDLPMVRLFEGLDGGGDDVVVHPYERGSLAIPGKGMRKELLTRRNGANIQAMIVTVEPGGGSGIDPYSHDGEEVGHVLAGELTLRVGMRSYRIGPGDTFCFESTLPHGFENYGDVDAVILWVVSRPFY
ncbi:cupin domain-containing protein [Salinarimonas ramus]|uniref:XRE family transcriptional regulator n=1 Tax=Salinarimonas ramus TaxID=690164 RepID=A0A917QCH7_9HYPH|nr:cupin domain-containing protein [Salinarimonas ramus]GGK40787.1 XRE family transcriptional regulator [Salinarimonas ramus]